MKPGNRRFHGILAIMFAAFVILIVAAFSTNSGAPLSKTFNSNKIDFSSGWTLSDGSEVDVTHLADISAPYTEMQLYHTLPASIGESDSLCFRCKNIFYSVYIDGELRYEPEYAESAIYTQSIGTRWNYIELTDEDADKTVEIHYYTVYEGANACLDHLTIGPAVGHVLSILWEKLPAFVTSLLLLFVGLILVIADIPMNMLKTKNHELLYLGFFALSIAIWCIVETNIFQFFTNDSRSLQLISCWSLMLIPIPTMLYLDAAFTLRWKFLKPMICYASGIEFAITTVLHFTGVMDYHQTLSLTHVMLFLSAFVMMAVIFENTFLKKQVHSIYQFLRALGFMAICFATIIDLTRYYFGTGSDSAMFVRFGLLIFIVCYGSSSLEKTINAVKLGAKSDLISQLAYHDGLTGIGNRTAFQEYLDELETKKETAAHVGIVMFDVNDLKYVNDNLGHQMGDAMLVSSASLIQSIFEPKDGMCYRIGGDEFAVILHGKDVETRCQEAIAEFKEAQKTFNEKAGKPFRISIASGYALYGEKADEEKLMDTYREADAKMYQNKKHMKSMQPRPEVYYAGLLNA